MGKFKSYYVYDSNFFQQSGGCDTGYLIGGYEINLKRKLKNFSLKENQLIP